VKRYIPFIVLIGFFIYLQSSPLSQHVTLKGVSPDFLLITISLAAFLLGPNRGMVIGFLTGLIVDIIGGGLLGISAFAYTVVGYLVGLVGQKVFGNSVVITISLLFTVTLIKAAILGMLAVIFLQPGYFGFFARGRIFLEAVLNSVITPLLFLIISTVERKITE
jgi:rod shape-determining protein MreD